MCNISVILGERKRNEGKIEGKIEAMLEYGLSIPKIAKRLNLSEEKVEEIVKEIYSENSMDIFTSLCVDGSKSPMSEDEISQFVSAVREEREKEMEGGRA